jgi:hypothetical protein
LKLQYSAHLQGQIVGQPLYVPGVPMQTCIVKGVCNTKPYDAIFVVTQANQVYALNANASPGTNPVIRSNQLPYVPAHGNSGTTPFWGITSTPVIDRARGILYVVAKAADPANPNGKAFHVHALSLSTLDDIDPVSYPPATIATGFQVPALTNPGGGSGTVTFEAKAQNQRPGLLLAPDFGGVDRLYVAFGRPEGPSTCEGGQHMR